MDFVPQKRFLLGANFRYLFSNLGAGNGNAQGVGVDIGFLYRQPFKDTSEFKAGLVLTDVSTSIRFGNTGVEQTIPSVLTAGMAYQFDPNTLVATDIPWTLSDDVLLGNQNVRIRSGIEHWFFDGKFGLRAGFVSFVTLPGEFSVGASYKVTDWSLDYAFMNHSDNLGNSHRMDANYYFDVGTGKPEAKPFMVQSLVGDQKIYLKWDIPADSQAEGYLIYVKSDADKDFHRAKQELLKTKYCLLRGAQNNLRYHIYVRSVVAGEEKYSCGEWVVIAKPMSDEAKKYFDLGIDAFDKSKVSEALYFARKAEELDPNNYDIKDLIQKLETTHHEGLVPEDEQPLTP